MDPEANNYDDFTEEAMGYVSEFNYDELPNYDQDIGIVDSVTPAENNSIRIDMEEQLKDIDNGEKLVNYFQQLSIGKRSNSKGIVMNRIIKVILNEQKMPVSLTSMHSFSKYNIEQVAILFKVLETINFSTQKDFVKALFDAILDKKNRSSAAVPVEEDVLEINEETTTVPVAEGQANNSSSSSSNSNATTAQVPARGTPKLKGAGNKRNNNEDTKSAAAAAGGVPDPYTASLQAVLATYPPRAAVSPTTQSAKKRGYLSAAELNTCQADLVKVQIEREKKKVAREATSEEYTRLKSVMESSLYSLYSVEEQERIKQRLLEIMLNAA